MAKIIIDDTVTREDLINIINELVRENEEWHERMTNLVAKTFKLKGEVNMLEKQLNKKSPSD